MKFAVIEKSTGTTVNAGELHELYMSDSFWWNSLYVILDGDTVIAERSAFDALKEQLRQSEISARCYTIYMQAIEPDDVIPYCVKYESLNELPDEILWSQYNILIRGFGAQYTLKFPEQLEEFRDNLERAASMKLEGANEVPRVPPKSAVAAAVDPSHYQGFLTLDGLPDLQWLEAKQREKAAMKNPLGFALAVKLQVQKYLDRLGEKDDETQEMLKALWYLKFLAAFAINDYKPIRVADIEDILKRA